MNDAMHLRRLAYKLRYNPNLERFYLPLDDLSDLHDLTRAVQSNTTVKEVSICCEYLEDDSLSSPEVVGLFRALGRLPKLERLVFDFIGSDADKLPVTLLSVVVAPASKLQALELSCVHLTGSLEDFEAFSHTLRLKPLRKFHIYACYLSQEFLEGSTDVLNPVLEEMAHLDHLEDALITALDFDSLGKLSSESLGNLVHLSSSLNNLVLGEFELNDQHLVALSVAMEHNRSLKELSFGCSLGAQGADALVAMLRSNESSLETLHIHLANLEGGEDHHVAIANAFRENHVMKRFSLFATAGNMSAKTQQAFADMLETNYVLEEMEFQDEDESLQPKMEMYLKLNDHGRGRLMQGDSTTREDWVTAIVELHDELDCVFHLISLNPAIFSEDTALPAGDRGIKRKHIDVDDEDL